MSLRTLFFFAAVVALTAAWGAGPAHAQSAPAEREGAPEAPSASAKERARRLHEEGLRHYSAGQYGRAIAAYRKAYALVPAPGILFNLAQAYRLRGDCRRAYRVYRRFLRVAASSPEAPLAREHSQALRPCAQKTETEREAAEAAEGSAPTPPTGDPTGAPSPSPPSPTITPAEPPVASAPEAAAAAASAEPEPTRPPTDFIAPTRDAQAGQNKKLLGIGIGAAGAALATVGIYFGLKARSAASDLDEFFEEGGTWTPELADREDALARDRTFAIGFGVVGAAAVGTGAVLYWLGRKEAAALEAGDEGPVVVAPHARGAVLLWRGAF